MFKKLGCWLFLNHLEVCSNVVMISLLFFFTHAKSMFNPLSRRRENNAYSVETWFDSCLKSGLNLSADMFWNNKSRFAQDVLTWRRTELSLQRCSCSKKTIERVIALLVVHRISAFGWKSTFLKKVLKRLLQIDCCLSYLAEVWNISNIYFEIKYFSFRKAENHYFFASFRKAENR